MAYYKRIRELREDNDKTQREVAEYLGTPYQYYAVYEKGGSEISRLHIRRKAEEMVSGSPSTFRWGNEISSQTRRLRARFPAASCRPQRSAYFLSSSYHRSDPS